MSEKKQSLREYLDEKLKSNSLKAPDRNPLVASQADLAKKVKALLNQYETKKLGKIDSPWNKYGAGHSIGDLLFGQSPELLDDMSYDGLKALVRGGNVATGGIGTLRPDKRLLDMPVPIPATGGLGVIKKPGGNWLTDSVENALKGLKKGTTDNGLELVRRGLITPEQAAARPEVPINSWIDNTLTKYVKNRMASPDDEVRKLADQGILHYQPRYTGVMKDTRTSAGFPEEGMAQSPLGHLWEDISDDKILSETKGVRSSRTDDFARVYPEFSKVADDAQIYQPYANRLDNLGWEHLIDELLNSTRADSGLPMNLRMKPEGFKGLTMEEAVKKVHGINQFRAEQAEAARKKMSRAEGIPTTKTYDDGFRWVAPEDVTKNPKHREYVVDVGKRGAWCTQGDACDYYAGGDSRVQILLDDFGNPHAQIAISNEFDHLVNDPDFIADFWKNQPYEYRERIPDANEIEIIDSPEFQEYLNSRQPAITEIKPLGNSWNDKKVQELMANDPNYQKKIQEKLQDFVKSGNWSDVADLRNAGLYREGNRFMSKEDILSEPGFKDWLNGRFDRPKSDDEIMSYYQTFIRDTQLDGGI